MKRLIIVLALVALGLTACAPSITSPSITSPISPSQPSSLQTLKPYAQYGSIWVYTFDRPGLTYCYVVFSPTGTGISCP